MARKHKGNRPRGLRFVNIEASVAGKWLALLKELVASA